MTRWIKIIQWLSLDTAVGAVFVCLLVCRQFDIAISWQQATLLGLVVWGIYTLDHLWDVHRTEAQTDRRQFHFRYRKLLLIALLVAFMAADVLLVYMPIALLIAGGILAILSLLYLAFANKMRGTKELAGAMLYCAGVMLVPLVNSDYSPALIVPMVVLFCLAWQNLLTFSLYDEPQDKQEGFRSFAISYGSGLTRRWIYALAAVQLVGVCALAVEAQHLLAAFFAWACALHLLILWVPACQRHGRYRIIGDWAFLMAGVLLV